MATPKIQTSISVQRKLSIAVGILSFLGSTTQKITEESKDGKS